MTTSELSMAFGPLTIAYDSRVLTPRPWVALQSRWAAELVGPAQGPERGTSYDAPLLELCAGAGHIGLLAAALTGRRLVAVDIDPVAGDFARANAARAGLADRVEVRTGPLETALGDGEQYAVALADPPWVTSDGVGRWPDDPLLAIDGGPDGLVVARACVTACTDHLVPGGHLLVQLGDIDQAAQLLTWVDQTRWIDAGLRSGEGGVVQALRSR